MYKRALILLLLTLCLVFPIQVSAERQSTSVSIDISFGDRTFTNVFDVSWNTEDVYRPYGYGWVQDDRQIILRSTKEVYSDPIAVLQGPFTFRILDSISTEANIVVEIITTINNETYHGFMYGPYQATSLEYAANGGNLESNDLRPLGIFVAPKDTRYYAYYYPKTFADYSSAYKSSVDTYYEFVEKYGDWYKTVDGSWFSNSVFYELSQSEMNNLFGSTNPILFHYGDTDSKIGEVQQKLGCSITFQLDDETTNSLRAYQRKNELISTGLIDQNTLDSLGL